MSDRHISNFRGRLRRINRIHKAGGGFEAAGTLGQSYYTGMRRKRSVSRWLLPVVLVLVAIVVVKGAVLAQIGAATYDARIAALASGDTVDRLGAYMLQADPLTVAVSGLFSSR